MEIFDKLGQKIVQTTETIADKTKETAHIVQLKYDLALEKEALEEYFSELGKLYFTKYINSLDEDFAKTTENICSSQMKIDALRAEINEIKGVKICKHCQNELQKDAAFCSACGTKVK